LAPLTQRLIPPLIIGDRGDEHVAAVIEQLDKLRKHAVVVDVGRLERNAFRFEGSSAMVDGQVVDFRQSGRGWIRRLAEPQWRRRTHGGSEAAAIRSAWSALLVSLAGESAVNWLTSMERLFLAENKLLQLRIADRLGVSVPRSVVVSHRDLIPTELGDELVIKPLGAGQFSDSEDADWVVYATPIRRDAVELDHLGSAPFLVQEQLRAEQHLRVVTVGERVWTCALDAEGLPLDWRKDEAAHHRFAVSLDTSVAASAVKLAAAACIRYSSQDWILQNGETYFVDLNPAGQWLFLPEPVASEVSAEIAGWLTSRGR
jgi:hypothetical protein